MAALFGIATLIFVFAGMFCFGWAIHGSLNHRLSIFGWSFDKDESSLPFHRAVLGISLSGLIAVGVAVGTVVAWLDQFATDF
jgi:hypothetical protein